MKRRPEMGFDSESSPEFPVSLHFERSILHVPAFGKFYFLCHTDLCFTKDKNQVIMLHISLRKGS